MLPIQEYFIEKIADYRLTKTDIIKALSQEKISGARNIVNEFFKTSEPDITTAKKIADILSMTDEEFEDLWYQTKDKAIREKIKARIYREKILLQESQVA